MQIAITGLYFRAPPRLAPPACKRRKRHAPSASIHDNAESLSVKKPLRKEAVLIKKMLERICIV